MKLDYGSLRELNPKLIYCSISGYGQTGPSAGPALPDPAAFAILARLPLMEEALPGLSLGTDLRYWHVASGLVLEALASQKLDPVLVAVDGDGGQPAYFARWLPVLDGPQDVLRMLRLEAAMPPLCRAGVPLPPGSWPEDPQDLPANGTDLRRQGATRWDRSDRPLRGPPAHRVPC